MAGSYDATAIITGGLTCDASVSACKSGIITTFFGLYCDVIPPKPAADVGGGHYPCTAWNKFEPGEIQKFYQPVPEQYYVVPKERESEFLRRYKPITITFKIGEFTTEKVYSIPESKARVVVKAFNMVDSTRQQINVAVTKIKRLVSDIKISVVNFRKRDK